MKLVENNGVQPSETEREAAAKLTALNSGILGRLGRAFPQSLPRRLFSFPANTNNGVSIMTKSKPTNTTTRRHLLTIAAGGAVAAAIPADSRAYPGHAADPIFAAIEKHRVAAAVWDAAVGVPLSFPEGPDPLTDEQWEERDRLDDAVDDTRELLVDAGVDLVGTKPTTHGGIIAAISYIRTQMRNDAFMPWEAEFEFEFDEGCPGDAQQTMKWIDAFLATIADAAAALDKAV
jgi:hypothetical protein